jgi:hypothetical protein
VAPIHGTREGEYSCDQSRTQLSIAPLQLICRRRQRRSARLPWLACWFVVRWQDGNEAPTAWLPRLSESHLHVELLRDGSSPPCANSDCAVPHEEHVGLEEINGGVQNAYFGSLAASAWQMYASPTPKCVLSSQPRSDSNLITSGSSKSLRFLFTKTFCSSR